MNNISFVCGKSYIVSGCNCEYKDDGKKAWRIKIASSNLSGVLPFKFGRKKDAQAGLNGLLKYIDLYNLESSDIKEEFLKLGPKKVCEIICEEMAW